MFARVRPPLKIGQLTDGPALKLRLPHSSKVASPVLTSAGGCQRKAGIEIGAVRRRCLPSPQRRRARRHGCRGRRRSKSEGRPAGTGWKRGGRGCGRREFRDQPFGCVAGENADRMDLRLGLRLERWNGGGRRWRLRALLFEILARYEAAAYTGIDEMLEALLTRTSASASAIRCCSCAQHEISVRDLGCGRSPGGPVDPREQHPCVRSRPRPSAWSAEQIELPAGIESERKV